MSIAYPPRFVPTEVDAATNLLSGLSAADAQALLDELTGRLNVSDIRNPLGYLATLVARHREGRFRSELGLRVAEARARRIAHENTMRNDEEKRDTTLAPVNLDALPPRLREIALKHVKRADQSTLSETREKSS